MTNHPEGREPCPELAQTYYAAIGQRRCIVSVRMTEDNVLAQLMKMPHFITNANPIIVPCLVTPLLTADERERLIGDDVTRTKDDYDRLGLDYERLIGGEG